MSELSPTELVTYLAHIAEDGVSDGVAGRNIVRHDAAQRQRIAQLEDEVKELEVDGENYRQYAMDEVRKACQEAGVLVADDDSICLSKASDMAIMHYLTPSSRPSYALPLLQGGGVWALRISLCEGWLRSGLGYGTNASSIGQRSYLSLQVAVWAT